MTLQNKYLQCQSKIINNNYFIIFSTAGNFPFSNHFKKAPPAVDT